MTSNERRHSEPADKLLFTELDARYTHPDDLIGRELPDWQEGVDPATDRQGLDRKSDDDINTPGEVDVDALEVQEEEEDQGDGGEFDSAEK